MNDLCIYVIQLRGQIDEGEINAMSPLEVTIERPDAATGQLSVCTDQSGLIGLMRHLHGLGFTFVSVTRIDEG